MTEGALISNFLHDVRWCYTDFERDQGLICEALTIASHAHAGQVRKYDQTPFLGHPLAVALSLAKRYQDRDLLLAGILHDAVEDCDDVTMSSIYEQFGEEVGYMVDAVTKVPLHFLRDEKLTYTDKIEKLLAGGMQDVRCLLLKLADREHNLKTLVGLKPHKQVRMAFETQAIYEPLREMLLDEDACTMSVITGRLASYLGTFAIQNCEQFKSSLYGHMYESFDEDAYRVAYSHSQKVVREINDRDVFCSLLDHEGFAANISLISLLTDGDDFCVSFSFVGGTVFSHKDTRLRLSGFITAH